MQPNILAGFSSVIPISIFVLFVDSVGNSLNLAKGGVVQKNEICSGSERRSSTKNEKRVSEQCMTDQGSTSSKLTGGGRAGRTKA